MQRNVRPPRKVVAILVSAVLWGSMAPTRPASAEALTPGQQLAHDIYKELLELDTTTATGDTSVPPMPWLRG